MKPPSRLFAALAAFILVILTSAVSGLREDEMDFRYWRNVESGKAFKAALLAVDDTGKKVQLYMSGGKKFIVDIAVYHQEDKAYVKEWIAWKASEAKKEVARAASGGAAKNASIAIRGALHLRLRTAPKSGAPQKKGAVREQVTTHQILAEVSTRDNAGAIPKGDLHIVAYVRRSLNNAHVQKGNVVPAHKKRSSSVREVKPKPLKLTFKPGQTAEHRFNVGTRNLNGEKAKSKSKQGKKTRIIPGFSWQQSESLIGMRARILIGGKLAAEAKFPLDLDRRIAEAKK